MNTIRTAKKYRGDAYVGHKKVYFYPQDHSSASQSSGYIYSSFTKTGRLWWDEFYGGQGAIYSSIDGQGSAYPLVEVDNASRVIKYVGILGYRYQSYGLVDMRIHDIRVVADLTRSNPNAPAPGEQIVADGTFAGTSDLFKGGPGEAFAQSMLDTALGIVQQVVSWWEGWWPRVHMSLTWSTPRGGMAMLHVSVDLLFDFRYESFAIETPADDTLTDSQRDAFTMKVANAVKAPGSLEDFFRVSSKTLQLALAVVCILLTAPDVVATPIVKAKAMFYYYALWVVWVLSLMASYGLGQVSGEFVIGLIADWLMTAMMGALTLGALGFTLYLITRLATEAFAKAAGAWAKPRLYWGAIGVVFYFTLTALMLIIWIQTYEIVVEQWVGE